MMCSHVTVGLDPRVARSSNESSDVFAMVVADSLESERLVADSLESERSGLHPGH